MVTAAIVWLILNALGAFVEFLMPSREMWLRIVYLIFGLVSAVLAFGLFAA